MAIRGYRIKRLEYAETPTFSLSDDGISWLMKEGETFGGGMLEVRVEDLKKLLEGAELDKETKGRIKKDIEESDGKVVLYHCF